MSSLLWDKADARILDSELAEINEWAQQHAQNCFDMKRIIQGRGTMTYMIKYCRERTKFSIGGCCTCGCKYYVGEGEQSPAVGR